ETVARLAAVNEIGKATTGVLDTVDLYDSLVRLVAQHLKARRVSVLVSEADHDTMTLVASVGIPDEDGLRRTVRVGEGIAGRVAAIRAMEELRPETQGHSRRMAELAGEIARDLGLPEERVELAVRAAALHELGRLTARPEEQERAGGRLRPAAEWFPVAVMATERLLAPIASLRAVREIILRSAD